MNLSLTLSAVAHLVVDGEIEGSGFESEPNRLPEAI